jgi:3-oxoacyl-[acyl-carrier-protein] synthase-3
MIGIKEIGIYTPPNLQSNFDLKAKFDVDDEFIIQKLGVEYRAVKNKDQETSDMCFMAFQNLTEKSGISASEIEVLAVITQNPDYNIPHVSGLVHEKAGLKKSCATFDISLGCSGYVYGLSILKSFMEANSMMNGVLITCDPYSKIIDESDKATAMLFGDAATATLMTKKPILTCGPFVFGTQGDLEGFLRCDQGILNMNGREIFNFAARVVPESVRELLKKTGDNIELIDKFIFHQGSKFIVDTIAKRLSISENKIGLNMKNFGNTVSSSIPIVLESELTNLNANKILLCGFGVGLSWASCMCERLGVK